MRFRWCARWFGLTGLLLMTIGLAGCDPEKSLRPDNQPRKVILVVIDSLRYDHLNAFGYRKETSPFIAHLVEESVVFDLAISPSNYTGVSVPAYFTGKPLSHVFAEHPDQVWIPEQEQTMAETLQGAGFETFLWGANLHLSLKGFDQGFSHFFNGYLENPMTSLVSIEGLIREVQNSHTDTGGREFHYVHTMDVHFPYHPPYPYERMFSKNSPRYGWGPAMTGMPRDHFGVLVWSNLPYYAENHWMTDDDVNHLVSLYDGTIRYTDEYLQELLDSLGYDPNQDMLIITADHGEQLFSHGWAAHSALLLMQEIHVPLIVRFPGFDARRVSGPVSLMDLYPTLCEMLDLERPEGLIGRSLLPDLKGESDGGDAAYSEAWHKYGPGASLVTRDRMYYFRANQSEMHPWRLWPRLMELYDISRDPECRYNLLESEPDLSREFHQALTTRFPQWATFPWDELSAPENGPTLGDDEFDGHWLRHVINGSSELSAEQLETGVTLDEVHPDLSATATLSEPGAPYALSFRYKVESGLSHFSLTDPDTEEAIWTYDVVKVSPDEIPLQVRVDIPGKRVEFRAEARDGGVTLFKAMSEREAGVTQFGGLQLRRLHVPDSKPGVTGSARDAEDNASGEELSESEKEALEAIGYVQ